MALKYWAVKWLGVIRITAKRFETATEAAHDCFGVIASDMYVKGIGGSLPPTRTVSGRRQAMSDDGWELIKLTDITK